MFFFPMQTNLVLLTTIVHPPPPPPLDPSSKGVTTSFEPICKVSLARMGGFFILLMHFHKTFETPHKITYVG
jgi:hypothetical protein